MRIKVTLVSDRVLEAEVAEGSVSDVEGFLESSGTLPAGWILCARPNGWPFRLNLAQCVEVERSAS
jgi:hypothetical protein